MFLPDEIRPAYQSWLAYNAKYWSFRPRHAQSQRVVLVDLFHDNATYLIASLWIAKSIALQTGARIVGLTGATKAVRTSCPAFDVANVRELAASFGVDSVEVFDPAEQGGPVDAPPGYLSLSDWLLGYHTPDGIHLGRFVYDSHLRAHLLPTLPDRADDSVLETLGEANACLSWLRGVFARYTPSAVVLGHLDYAPWGLMGDVADRCGVPLYYFRFDRGLALFKIMPEQTDKTISAHTKIRKAEARYVQKNIYPAAARFASMAVACLPASGQGGFYENHLWGAEPTHTAHDPQSVRADICERFDWDAATPIVSVFMHCVSDTPLSDTQIHKDRGEWICRVVAFAAQHPERNWIIKKHPMDAFYDSSNLFGRLAGEYGHIPHLRFVTDELSRVELATITDMVTTIRGSVAFQFAQLGIPVVGAGDSIYADLGFVGNFTSEWAYARALVEAQAPMPDQVEKARLYTLYERFFGVIHSLVLPPVSVPAYFVTLQHAQNAVALECDPLYQAIDALRGATATARAMQPFVDKMAG